MLRKIIYYLFKVFGSHARSHRNDGRVTDYNPWTDKW